MAKVIKAAIIAVAVVFLVVTGIAAIAGTAWGTAASVVALTATQAASMYLTAFIGTLVAGGIGMLSSKGVNASGANFGTKVSGRSGASPRQLIYGTCRVGGTIVKMDTRATKNGILGMTIVVAGHKCDGFDEVYFNELKLTLSTATVSGETVHSVTTSKFTNSDNDLAFGSSTLARFTFHDGSQTAVDGLASAGNPTRYPATAKFLGCSYFYFELVYDPENMPNIPSIWFVMRGKNIYDPRTSALSTTDLQRQNPALQVRDYLVDTTYGLKSLAGELNDGTGGGGFSSAANTCDQLVTLTVDGNGDPATQERRYTSNGFSNFSASGSGLIESITTSCAGNVTYTNGKFNLFAGASQTPALSITDDNVLGTPKITTQSMSGELFNSVKSIFINKGDNYQASEVTQYDSSPYLAADTPSGEASANFSRTLELRYPFTTSETMAQRLQRISLDHQRQSTTLEVVTTLEFMKAQPNDWLYVTNSRLGYVNKIFEIQGMSMTFLENDGNIFAATSLQLQEMSASVFGFTFNEYSTPQPNSGLPVIGELEIDPPTIGTPVQVTNLEGQTAKINIRAVWSNAVDSAIQGTEIQFKAAGGSEYQTATLAGKGRINAEISNVKVGLTYNIRVRHFSFDNVYSVYSSVANIAIAQPDTINAILASTITTTVDKPFNVELGWTNPSNTNMRAVEVHVGTTTSFTPSTSNLVGTYYGDVAKKKTVLIGRSHGLLYDTELPNAPHSYYFKLRAINIYGSASAYSTSPVAKIKKTTTVDVENLSATVVNTGTLNASNVSVINLSATNINTGKLTLSGSATDAVRLGKGTFEDTSVSGFFLGFTASSPIEPAFSIGNATSGLSYKPSAGLSIKGNLEATTGKIAEFIINTTSITDLADSFGLSSAVTGGDDIRFYAGATLANKANAPFRVTEAGALTANSATIIGAITATSGSLSSLDVSGALTVGTSGKITGGTSTSFNTGAGFFLGYDSSAYKFSIGDASTNKNLTWDGTDIKIGGAQITAPDNPSVVIYDGRSGEPPSVTSARVLLTSDTNTFYLKQDYTERLRLQVSYPLGALTSGTVSGETAAINSTMAAFKFQVYYALTSSPTNFTQFGTDASSSRQTTTGGLISNYLVKTTNLGGGNFKAELQTKTQVRTAHPTLSGLSLGAVDDNYNLIETVEADLPAGVDGSGDPTGFAAEYVFKVVVTVTNGSASSYPATGSPASNLVRSAIVNGFQPVAKAGYGYAVEAFYQPLTTYRDGSASEVVRLSHGNDTLEVAAVDRSGKARLVMISSRGASGSPSNTAWSARMVWAKDHETYSVGSNGDYLIGLNDSGSHLFLGKTKNNPLLSELQISNGRVDVIGSLYVDGTEVTGGGGSGTITNVIAGTNLNGGGTSGAVTLNLDSTISGNHTFSNNLIISGNLTVNGTTTTVDTDNLNVKDKNITLNYSTGDSSSTANGAGITIQDAVNATTNATILWDSTNDKFDFSHKLTTPSLDVGGNIAVTGTVDGVDIASRNSVLTTTTNTANSALSTANSATTTANAALPKAGGTMSGTLTMGSNAISSSGTISSGAITSSGNVSVGGSAYTTNADLNLLGDGLAIKNDKNGSNNNWSYIQNTSGGSQANLLFTTGAGSALTLNHDRTATFQGAIASGAINVASGGISVGGVEVITSGRLLTNIALGDINTNKITLLNGASANMEMFVSGTGTATTNFRLSTASSNIMTLTQAGNLNPIGGLTTTTGVFSGKIEATQLDLVGTDNYIAYGSAGTAPSNGDYLRLRDVASGNDALQFYMDSSKLFSIDGQTGNAYHKGTISSGAITSSGGVSGTTATFTDSVTLSGSGIVNITKGLGLYVSANLSVSGLIFKNGGGDVEVSGNLRINSGGLKIGTQEVITSGRALTNITTISSGAITTTALTSSGYVKTPTVGMGAGASVAASINHTASVNEGLFWHTTNTDYFIARTSGAWSSPNYQQLKLDWDTGIELDGGTAYGKSGVNISAGNFKVGGTTVIDASRNITGVNITANGIYPLTGLFLDRQTNARHGISWYGSSYPSWATYMSSAGATGSGPTGTLTAPSGSLVSSWALRSYIENVAGYGWTFESAAGLTNTSPTVRFEIRSSDGSAYSQGNITAASGFKVGTTTVIDASRNLTNINTASPVEAIIGPHATNAYLSPSAGALYFGSKTNGKSYSINSGAIENIGGPYTKLHINWHTGIKIGAAYNYGGIRFFNNSLDGYTPAELFSIGNTDQHVRAAQNFYSGGEIHATTSVTAPIYKVGTATVIDASRNLTNIGTISSGAITAPSFSGAVFGAASGAPDSTIWGISRDSYPTYGIFYDEGNPDKILYKWAGVTKFNINMETGALDTPSTISSGAITTPKVILTDARYGIGVVNASSGRFDTVDSGIASDPLELCYFSGTGVRVGTGLGNKYLSAGSIQINGTTVIDASRNLTAAQGNFTESLQVGGVATDNSYDNGNHRLLFGGGNSDSVGNYYIGTNLENVGGNYSKLDLRWHTGIRMGAQGAYGGIRFYSNEDLVTKLMSIGEGNAVTDVKVYNDLNVVSNIEINGTTVITSGRAITNCTGITLTGGSVSSYGSVTAGLGSFLVGSRGKMGQVSNDLFVCSTTSQHSGLRFANGAIHPTDNTGAQSDSAQIDLGASSYRFSDIFARNGTINTSDRNEKQDIEVLSAAEQRVAVAAKGLLRKFRWKDAVSEKGDSARIHFGIVAQDLQAAFVAEGLDAGRYGMFTSDTWDEDGVDKTRMGVRYSELLAFIISAI